MDNFIIFLEEQVTGVFIFVLLLFLLLFAIRSIAKTFGLGAYADKTQTQRGGSLVFIAGDLLTKIINDFRHLLALILVVIFAGSLTYTFVVFGKDGKLSDFTSALQAVVSTLGGLVGSIVGYYFGESAAKKNFADAAPTVTNASTLKQEPTPTPAPRPPEL